MKKKYISPMTEVENISPVTFIAVSGISISDGPGSGEDITSSNLDDFSQDSRQDRLWDTEW